MQGMKEMGGKSKEIYRISGLHRMEEILPHIFIFRLHSIVINKDEEANKINEGKIYV
jgi:hypothetical protein